MKKIPINPSDAKEILGKHWMTDERIEEIRRIQKALFSLIRIRLEDTPMAKEALAWRKKVLEEVVREGLKGPIGISDKEMEDG